MGLGWGSHDSHPRFAEIRDTPPSPSSICRGSDGARGSSPGPGIIPIPGLLKSGTRMLPHRRESPSPISSCRGRGWAICHRGFHALSHALAMAVSGHVPVAPSLALSGSLPVSTPFPRGAILLSGLRPAGSAQSLGPAGPGPGPAGGAGGVWPRSGRARTARGLRVGWLTWASTRGPNASRDVARAIFPARPLP
jgi:hypothetical protein